MDSLTVTRLRTECRLRRLPVSGRKRNLVLRLLPFADVILGGSGGKTSKEVELSACGSPVGVTHVIARPLTTPFDCRSAQPVQSASTEIEAHRPFVPLDSLVSSWNNFDEDDDGWTVDMAGLLDPAARIGSTDQPERTDLLAVRSAGGGGCCDGDNLLSSIIVGVPTAPGDKAGTDGCGDRHELGDDDGEPRPNEPLVCRWLRQQLLIDELRRELCRYRRALAAARLQTTTTMTTTRSLEDHHRGGGPLGRPLTNGDHDADGLPHRVSGSFSTNERYARTNQSATMLMMIVIIITVR